MSLEREFRRFANRKKRKEERKRTTCDETYAQSVRNFKEKWFGSSRKDRLITHINEAFNQTRMMCLNMIGIDSALHSLTPMMVAQEKLVDKFGEFVDKTVAAQILGVTRATIYAMIADGRLSVGYEGKRVSVRSISDYMQMRGA